jgi:hypothetical protein
MMNTKLIRSKSSTPMFTTTSAVGYWPSFYVLSSEQNQKPANNPATISGRDHGSTEVLEGCSVS